MNDEEARKTALKSTITSVKHMVEAGIAQQAMIDHLHKEVRQIWWLLFGILGALILIALKLG